MNLTEFTLETSDAIACAAWDAPAATNLLTMAAMDDLEKIIDHVSADESVKGLLITSAKKNFCVGADLALISALMEAADVGEAHAASARFNDLLRRLETCGKPVAAALPGSALGGGMELALACHYRVAADPPATLSGAGPRFGLPEVRVGLMPGGGGTQRLPRLIGIAAALPLLLLGKTLTPSAAQQAGLLHAAVPPDDLIPHARRWLLDNPAPRQPWDTPGAVPPGGLPYGDAGQVFPVANARLRQATFANYPAARAIASAVYEGLLVEFAAGLRVEARYFAKTVCEPVAARMVRTLFTSTRALNNGARRPAGLPRRSFEKIAVAGAGMMGAGIARAAAAAGMTVVLVEQDPEAAERGLKNIAARMDADVKKGRMTEAGKTRIMEAIHVCRDDGDLKDCRLVIEAVFEDHAVKAAVTGRLSAAVPADALFGSNTSTLPISGLAGASAHPENFIGIHFFSPVERMQLVEIIVGEKTAPGTLAGTMDFVAAIGKTPIVVNDSRGFYTSRCVGTYVDEGLAMLREGIPPALVENAARMAGMPVGPLALCDEVSIELAHTIRQKTRDDLGDACKPSPGDPVLQAMVDRGRLGRKNRKGFYDYPDKGKKSLWPELAELFPADGSALPGTDDLITRFLSIQALEAVRCMDENVLTDARDGDVGAILGWGFAPWSGGPLSFVDSIGAREFADRCADLASRHGERFLPPPLLLTMAKSGGKFYS